jgi:hypothetical protein
MRDHLHWYGSTYALVAVCGAIVVGLLTFGVHMNHVACTRKWEASGYTTKFDVYAGCMVHLPNGRWVPESAVREIQ